MVYTLQVNINLQLTLPESSENEALFQLHGFLKSDSEAVLHTLQRPLSLPYRSPIVRTMRRVILFPFFLIGMAPVLCRLSRCHSIPNSVE